MDSVNASDRGAAVVVRKGRQAVGPPTPGFETPHRLGPGSRTPPMSGRMRDPLLVFCNVPLRAVLHLVYLRVGRMEPPYGESIAERFEALAALREEGLIRHLGLSNVDTVHLAEARAIASVVAVQNQFHAAKRDDVQLLAAYEEAGIAFVPFFPMGGGRELVDVRPAKVAARHGAAVSQIGLAAGLLTGGPGHPRHGLPLTPGGQHGRRRDHPQRGRPRRPRLTSEGCRNRRRSRPLRDRNRRPHPGRGLRPRPRPRPAHRGLNGRAAASRGRPPAWQGVRVRPAPRGRPRRPEPECLRRRRGHR
jgi:hypothetical protein